MSRKDGIVLSVALLGAIAVAGPDARAQHGGHQQAAPAGPAPVRISEQALHAAGGVPPGWRFTLPPGDPVAGRGVFVQFKCYTCHAVKGEQFPLAPGEAATAGPELTGMGSHHPAEYFAESILNPSAVVLDRPGYSGGDGRSIMPPQLDLTLREWIDVVAYVKSLTGDHGHHAPDRSRERAVGPYRVRLAYRTPADDHAHGHGHGHDHGHAHHHASGHGHHHASGHGHQHATGQPGADAAGGHAHHHGGGHAHHHAGARDGGARANQPGSLVVWVTDATSGQPMPYLTVTARIEQPGKPARSVVLAPTIGADGLHYAARTPVNDAVTRITLSLSPAAVQLAHGAPPAVRQRHTVSFDWK